ncbi:Cysteine-rich secretory protein family protein [Cryptosporidium meleagridis]|uniref:Cysteine-rich secretory protein family protein n=1 Tax=Cryptosporidium meleagridis TaxID=93969 RepID=A0A2P4Z3T8_9CRYT|nr:Cysteine-rich secretory protein family protein [Cryptosporidium meleagridis]
MRNSILLKIIFFSFLDLIYSQVNIMTDEYRIKILNMHNELRAKEASSATYMIKLAYDYSLEGYAANWGMKCMNGQFQHSPQTWPNRASPGENLYASSIDVSKLSSWDPSNVVKSWWDEREHFNWKMGGPEGGYPVGHWTQVVRAAASTVGCAIIVRCPGSWKTYVICHYDFGNLGYIPYPNFKVDKSLPQKPCSQCPSGYNCCENNLCVGIINPKVPPPGELSIRTGNGACDDYMKRLCSIRNGACPQSCLDLEYPTIKKGLIVQQCTCVEGESVSPTMAWQFKLWYNRGNCSRVKGNDGSSYSMKGLVDSGVAKIGTHDLDIDISLKNRNENKKIGSNRFARDLSFMDEPRVDIKHGPGLIADISTEQDNIENKIPTKGDINSTTNLEHFPSHSNSLAKIRNLSDGERDAIM